MNKDRNNYIITISPEINEYTIISDELILFIPAKKEYYWISGIAKTIFEIIENNKKGLKKEEIINTINNLNDLTINDINIINSGIESLLELGIANEQ